MGQKLRGDAYKASIYISCNSKEKDDLNEDLCNHEHTSIYENDTNYIAMCVELQKQINGVHEV